MWLLRNIIFYVLNFIVFQFSCANYLNHFETWMSREVFLYGSGLLLIIVIYKMRNKWTGIMTMNRNAAKFNISYSAQLSRKFMRWTYLFYGIEIVVSLVFPFIYLYFDTLTWPFAALLLFNGLESIFYLITNKNQGNFKVGMNENALVHNARGLYVLPFHRLKRIEHKYDEYFFIYESGETLTIPEYIVEESDLPQFKQMLVNRAREKEIFYSDKLRS